MTDQLPPPSGPSYPPPEGLDRPPLDRPQLDRPTTAPGAMPPPTGPIQWAPALPQEPQRLPGNNGLAIASLVLGLLFFVPIASILAIVFGIVALNQLRYRRQGGRGMAITGIVLGSLVVLAWAAFVVVALANAPDTGSAGGSTRKVSIGSLHAGDCFDGIPKDVESLDTVTPKACDGPHQGQVGAIVELPEGDFPGADKAADLAGKACADKLEALMREDSFGDVDLIYLYPDSGFGWKLDRSAVCILESRDGSRTGSALV